MVSFMMVKSPSCCLQNTEAVDPLGWVGRSDFGSKLVLVGLRWQTLTAHSDGLGTCNLHAGRTEPLRHAGLNNSFQFVT
jgi:hypothetical protein